MDNLAAMAAMPGTLSVGGRTFVIQPPTPGDMIREALQMKQLARAACRSPVEVAASKTNLPAAVFAVLVSEALKLESGGGPEPNESAIRERYALPDGVRWRLHYHVTRSGGALPQDEADKLVTDANCVDVCEAIDRALQFRVIDEKKAPPPTGTPG